MSKVNLVSQEGETFEIEVDVATKSTLIKSMIEDSGTGEAIPLPNVKATILKKIIEFCTQIHTQSPPEIEKPLRSANFNEVVAAWYASFIEVDQEVLFEIILAANYLDIKPLLELSCAKVASMLKGKSPEEIRKQFNIENDFTPEEEAQLREENKWASEDF